MSPADIPERGDHKAPEAATPEPLGEARGNDELSRTSTEAAAAETGPRWRSEVGRVEWQKVGRRQYRFVLVAVGPNGRYTAAQSSTFRGTPASESTAGGGAASAARLDDLSSDAFNALASALWQQGWEPTGLGRSWHDATYRRVVPVTPPTDDGGGAADVDDEAETANATPAEAGRQQQAATD